MFSTEYSLEVINANTSKAHAVFSILKDFNIDKKETIAFGDGFNDYELLNEAGMGFIMGNAHYKLKNSLPHLEIIDYNDNNGVLKKLKNIFNI
jgi:hydroxymethylpyrimidine pyrophosphatase-like HAD family hydrolase